MGESIRVESVVEVSDDIDKLGRKQGVKEWMDVVVRGEGMKMKETASTTSSTTNPMSSKKPRKKVKAKEVGVESTLFGMKGIVDRLDHVQSLLFSEDSGRLGSLKYSR